MLAEGKVRTIHGSWCYGSTQARQELNLASLGKSDYKEISE
jgi:hypothetical protein